jgi:lysophospholipase L1-like esterase
LLGADYTVGNFGVSGSTVSLDSNLPYMNQTKFQEAKNFDPDIVVIMLGTNDANQEISPNENNFETDYTQLITSFQQLEGQQLIWIVKSPPIFSNNSSYNNTYLENNIIPQTDAVAQRMDLPTIDMYNALDAQPNYFMDGVHPDSNGATVIATQVYDAITLPNGSPNTALFAAGYSG